MTDRPAPRGGWSSSAQDDEGWGPATAVRAGSARSGAPRRTAPRGRVSNDDWAAGDWQQQAPARSAEAAPAARAAAPERGLVWWAALLVLFAIAAVGGIIDSASSGQIGQGFNIGIVVASLAAIVLVRRSQMFPIVIAPPIVYTVAAVLQLYLRSGGLSDKRVVFDAAANYLVYGFPAIASATAVVLIVGGVRLIIRR
ncbi:MAG TPA: DUF6542 domain-containing protein [Jatrophihabitans sp.]|nr:DUF6542 domain-containing protein [Jatrophihabitans sp.]